MKWHFRRQEAASSDGWVASYRRGGTGLAQARSWHKCQIGWSLGRCQREWPEANHSPPEWPPDQFELFDIYLTWWAVLDLNQ